MPRGPQDRHRSSDVAGTVARIAIGEITDETEAIRTTDRAMGRKGGRARVWKLSVAQRTAIAKQPMARWAP